MPSLKNIALVSLKDKPQLKILEIQILKGVSENILKLKEEIKLIKIFKIGCQV